MAYTKQEYYETGTNTSTGGYGANVWGGQTFTPANSHTITRVGVFVFKDGSPSGDGYIDLYDCDQVTHLPTGSRLARATYATADIVSTDTNNPEWLEANLDAGVALTSGTEYALVFSQPSSDVSNRIQFKSDTPTPTYAGGVLLFSNTGFANLAVYSDYDYQFREYSGTADAAFIPRVFII